MKNTPKPTSSDNRDDLYDRVLADWHERLRDGNWMSRKNLIQSTAAELCDALLLESNPTAWGDLPNPHELAWMRFEKDVLPKLLDHDDYEERTVGGQLEIRSCKLTHTPPPANPTASWKREPSRSSLPDAHPAGHPSAVDQPPLSVPEELPGDDVSADDLDSGDGDTLPAQVEAFQAQPDNFDNRAVHLVEPNLPAHELAELFPETPDDEFQRIKADMQANGQQVPAWTHEGELLDGRTRQKAAKELGLKLLVEEWNGTGSLTNFVLSLNLHRRHLDASQRAMVAARIKPMFEEEARERMLAGKTADPMANLPQGSSRKQAAEIMKVSDRSVETASTVIKKGTPELVKAVEQGEVSLAAAGELTDLPAAQQKKVLKRGKTAVKAKAQMIRTKKAGKRQGSRTAPSPKSGPVVAPAKGNEETLTIRKPKTAADKKEVAAKLSQFLGNVVCEELASTWLREQEKTTPAAPERPGIRLRNPKDKFFGYGKGRKTA